MQTGLADQAVASIEVTELVLAEDCPDVLIHVAGLVQPAPAGEVVVAYKLRPRPRRRHGQVVGPERFAKRFQRLCASIFLAYRKRIAPLRGGYLKAYRNGSEAMRGIDAYLDLYNREWSHQSLGYQTRAQVFAAEDQSGVYQSRHRRYHLVR